MMQALMTLVYALSGLLVLAEALNKLERSDPLDPSLDFRGKALAWLKVGSWSALSVGGAGALATPLLDFTPPDVHDTFAVVGLALLIARTRLKERWDAEPVEDTHD